METRQHFKNSWEQIIFAALPNNIRNIIKAIPQRLLSGLEEIRIREGRPFTIYSYGDVYFISPNGQPSFNPAEAYYITNYDSQKILQLISNYSIYALEDEIKNGYITLKGGYRIGLTGKAVLEEGRIKTLKYINSYNIRISREVIGAADKVLSYIIDKNMVLHTLILSPPQMGKTTLLRDIARQLSNGFSNFNGIKVGIVDERSEIAACFQGIPQNNVGIQTDILDACPKAEGIVMLMRSMSPNVIITDEIGKFEDIQAIEEALNTGISIITTAHGKNIQDALNRPVLANVINKRLFDRILILGNSKGVGTVEAVYETKNFTNILKSPIK